MEEKRDVNGNVAQSKNASAVLGKFKNVDALAQAYSALQAEFTRRSQRLKELERERENLTANNAKTEGLGVEKLRKNSSVRRANGQRFDAFVADMLAERNAEKNVENIAENIAENSVGNVVENADRPLAANVQASEQEQAEKQEKNVESTALDMGTLEENSENMPTGGVFREEMEVPKTEESEREQQTMCLQEGDAAIEKVESEKMSVVNHGEAVLSSEGLYQKVLEDEQVRLRVIGEYLSSIGKSGAPVTVGNAGIVSAPPLRAKSIADAGGMALHYFKTEKGK